MLIKQVARAGHGHRCLRDMPNGGIRIKKLRYCYHSVPTVA